MSILLQRRMNMTGPSKIYLYKNGQYNTSLLGDEQFKIGGLYVSQAGANNTTPTFYFSHEEDHINIGCIPGKNRTVRYSAVLKLPEIALQTKKFGGSISITLSERDNYTNEMRAGFGLSEKAIITSSFDTAFGITNLIDFQYKSQTKNNFYMDVINNTATNYAFITIWSCYTQHLRSLNLYELWIEI